MKETIEIPDGWYKKQTIPKLLEARELFRKEQGSAECTCDYCIDVTRCSLAYDGYNTGGDCLLAK